MASERREGRGERGCGAVRLRDPTEVCGRGGWREMTRPTHATGVAVTGSVIEHRWEDVQAAAETSKRRAVQSPNTLYQALTVNTARWDRSPLPAERAG